MATFSVKRWDEFETDDSSLSLVPPEHHPYAWLAPRWWYRGKRTIYETCAKVANSEYQIYIDGYTPTMGIEMSIDNGEVDILYHKDIRRIAITQDYSELLNPDGDFVDIDMEWKRNDWRIVKNTLPPSVPIDNVVVFTADPTYVIAAPTAGMPPADIGGQLTAQNGDYTGGNPGSNGTQPFLRYRWQVRNGTGDQKNGSWTTSEPWAYATIDDLQPEDWWPENYTQIRFQNQVRDFAPGTNSQRSTNRFASWLDIEEPVDP